MTTAHFITLPVFILSMLFMFSAVSASASTESSISTQAPLDCLLEPSVHIELSSEAQGVVKEVKVQRGDRVKAGQVVVTLTSTVEAAVVDTAKARMDFSSRKVERSAELYRQGLISDTEQDEMLTEKKLAEFQLHEARMRLKQREIRSPISGVVVEQLKEPGEYVDKTTVLRIIKLNPMYAEVILPAERYGTINKGDIATLYPLGGEQSFKGIVKIIDPIIDAASNTFGVTVSLDNSQGKLSAGIRCKIEFNKENPR